MGLRVLLTNSDTILLSLYESLLVNHFFEVRTASTALDCLELLRQWRPDVLVLDADLPWGSGLGVLALMHEDTNADLPVVPALLLTSDTSLAEEDIPLPEHRLLLKPVLSSALVAAILDVVRNSSEGGINGQTEDRISAMHEPGRPSQTLI